MPLQRRYITTDELCERWRVVRSTLYRWGQQNIIRPYRIGHHNLYAVDEIEQVEKDQFRHAKYKGHADGN